MNIIKVSVRLVHTHVFHIQKTDNNKKYIKLLDKYN